MGEGEGSDIPPKNAPLDSVKKLARQLDFNAFGGTPVTAPLPEHPQPSPTLPPLPATKLGSVLGLKFSFLIFFMSWFEILEFKFIYLFSF